MKRTFFVYAFIESGKVIYIGISRNPAQRLIDCMANQLNSNIGRYLEGKRLSEINIEILEVIKSNHERVKNELSQKEQYWINKFLIDGHPLKNIVIKRVSHLKEKRYLI